MLGKVLALSEEQGPSTSGTFHILYSRVHISSDEVFSKILKKPSIVQKKMIPHMNDFGLFNKMKLKKS